MIRSMSRILRFALVLAAVAALTASALAAGGWRWDRSNPPVREAVPGWTWDRPAADDPAADDTVPAGAAVEGWSWDG
jgi:hypothetical protein